MKIKRIILILSTVAFGHVACYGQIDKGVKKKNCKCSKLIKQISKEWKADSLAGNGYRLSVYDKLLVCNLDKINEQFLLKHLGSPSDIRDYTTEISYHYNYYDYKQIDLKKSKKTYFGWYFLTVDIDSKTRRVVKIREGHGEY